MRIISIDCGLKNLAYCVLDFQDPVRPILCSWEVFDVQASRFEDIPVALIRCLDERKDTWLGCDTVLIERQPGKNRKMVILQHLLHSYFLIRGTIDTNTIQKVQIISAMHKLGSNGGNMHGKKNYSQRKKTSVIMARDWLNSSSQAESWKECFEHSTKKDDLADCLNQALYGFKYTRVEEPAKVPIEQRYANLRPRKPTSSQERKGYSASNVLWLYSQNPEDFRVRIGKETSKWNKAIKKWFETIETCEATFEAQKNKGSH